MSSTVGVALVATLTSGCQSDASDRATAVGTETCSIEIAVELPDPDDPDASRLGFDTPDEALAAFAAEQTAARERGDMLPSDDVARLEADAVARVATAALSQLDRTSDGDPLSYYSVETSYGRGHVRLQQIAGRWHVAGLRAAVASTACPPGQ